MRASFLTGLLAFAAVGMTSAAEPGPLAWPEPTAESRPWTRWWWLGSAVDEANLTRILEEFKHAGIGGVEITPIYGAKGHEDKFIDFLSPKYMAMLAHTANEAKRLGLGVDMATGTGWPFGGPRVTSEDASARLNQQKYEVAGGEPFKGTLPRTRLQCLVAVSETGERQDLAAKVKDGRLDWTAPAGKWRVYALALDGPVMKVKRAAPGGVGDVLDPFSIRALNRYLADFDKAFASYRGAPIRGQFHDSYEYYNASWTPDFLKEFAARRGYDLREQLPAFFGEGPQDIVARVKCDYRETISDLHLAYVQRWTEWCHAHGWKSRNQAHGGPANLLDTYSAADIPEMEVYRDAVERQMPMMKLAASAAHVTGKKLVSAESFTWLGEHFQVPLSQAKDLADRLFLAGVNHLVYHGTPYSPKEAPWPGWQFYAAVNFGPQGGLWRDLPAFNAYVTRVQSVLQAGYPSNDVLLYLPIHDKWQTANGMMMPFETEGRWMESLPFHQAAMTLSEKGYGFDAVSDRQLAEAKVDGGHVILGGNRYRVVVVPKCRHLPPATMKTLLDLGGARGRVVFTGHDPEDVPGFGDLEQRRKELKDIVQASRNRPVGRGSHTISVSGNLELAMNQINPAREPMTDVGIQFIRRSHDAGYQYFLVNRGTKVVDGWVTLGTAGQSAVLLDPMSDKRAGSAAVRRSSGGATEIYLQVQSGESLVLRTFAGKTEDGVHWPYHRTAGEPRTLVNTWKVSFIDGGPVLPTAYETTTLASWTTRDDPELKRFAGTAKYTISFDRPAGGPDDWLLDLGRLCESARVKINGQDVGTLFAPPYRVAVGKHLRPAGNTLEVEVTNLAANRIRDLDRRKENWKYFYDANLASHPSSRQRGVLDASNWPLRDSGLIGPVTLTPVKLFSPAQERNL